MADLRLFIIFRPNLDDFGHLWTDFGLFLTSFRHFWTESFKVLAQAARSGISHLLPNKFFDLSSLCIRSVDPLEIQNGRQALGAPKWLTVNGKGSAPSFLGAPINFYKIDVF